MIMSYFPVSPTQQVRIDMGETEFFGKYDIIIGPYEYFRVQLGAASTFQYALRGHVIAIPQPGGIEISKILHKS